jgi:thiamine biosynthesis lipoprotein
MGTSRTEGVMGIPWTVTTRTDAPAATLDEVFADLHMIDAVFSTYRASSEISRIRAGALRIEDAGRIVSEVRELCDMYSTLTHGYFSAWYGGSFDPTGLVKGWAIARASRILERAGHRDHFVDGAGDVLARGEAARGEAWRVGIRHPVRRDKVAGVVCARDLAVVTSGTYERGPHIVDPHTRAAATELLSLTVIGPDIVAADVFATAAFAMGRGALEFIDSQPGYEALAIDADQFSASTRGFTRLLAA